jgi:hypothetical protein
LILRLLRLILLLRRLIMRLLGLILRLRRLMLLLALVVRGMAPLAA